MKKNDIIAQKLFETCKLSEFYLNLLKHEDESPMQLAHAYKQKLYEIVERYDRLLNANRQREQLNNNKLKKPKSISLSRTSTPHKSTSALNTPNGQMPISILTSNSSTNLPPNSHSSSSYSSTATSTPASTPGHSTNKSSFGTYTRSSTRSIYSQANQQHHYSNKQMQRFAYLYTDTTDESDLEEDDDELSRYDYKTAANNVKCQLEFDTYSTSGNSKKSETNSESDEEEEDKCIDGDSNQNIEKSYSNLSKDSGVFGESYHSECSNHIQGIGNTSKQTISENEHNETGEDRVSDEDNTFEENLTSPSSSSSYSRDEPIYRPAQQSTPKSTAKTETPNDSFIWGSVSRLVEEESSTKGTNKIDIYSNSLNRPVKPNFFLNKLNNEHQSKNLLKSALNNNYRTGNIDVDNTSMMSMMLDSDNSVSSLTSPKPYTKLNDSPTDPKETTNKGSPFIFNYNSLMNVSMLDNIQATNTNNSEVDNMNCSILMFN